MITGNIEQLFLQLNKLAAINSFIRECLYKLGEELSKHNFKTCRSPVLVFIFRFSRSKSTSNGNTFKICLTSKKYMLGASSKVFFHQCLKMLQLAILSVTIPWPYYNYIQRFRCHHFVYSNLGTGPHTGIKTLNCDLLKQLYRTCRNLKSC